MIAKDLLGIYNNLINVDVGLPVGVFYSKANKCLVFTQYNWRLDVSVLNYYCSDLIKIKRTVLLPVDVKKLLDTIKILVESNQLNQDRLLISPIKYGLKVYRSNPMNLSLGPIELGELKFVTSNNWLFRKVSCVIFKNIIGDITK